MYRLRIWLRDGRNKIWLTQAISVVVAVVLALGAAIVNRWLPSDSVPTVSAQTLDGLLSVIATSMLSVAIFSLGILVSAFASAAASATPRATELVMSDEGTRRAIGSFIAAFIYAVVAKTALGLEYYGPVGRFILFIGTLLVLVYLIVTLVMWVRTLSTLGRLGDTLTRINRAGSSALAAYVADPYLGARVGERDTPSGERVFGERVGFLTHIDVAHLNAMCERKHLRCHLRVRPGAFVGPSTLVAVTTGPSLSAADRSALLERLVVADSRSYEQDPRFGLIVLAEVAQRALSPAVNDPGTAIEVASIVTKLLVTAFHGATDQSRARFDHVTLPPVDEADFVRDGFGPIARDGAANLELSMRLQKLLAAVAADGPPAMRQAAVQVARDAMERTRLRGGLLASEVEQLAALHAGLFGGAEA